MSIVLHVFPYTIFAVNYVNSFCEDNLREHLFYLYGSHNIASKAEMLFHEDANIYYEKDMTELPVLRKIICKANNIVLQCLPENKIISSFLMNFLKNSKVNLIIYPWGRELYKTSDLYATGRKDVIETVDKAKDFFVNSSKAIIISKYGYEYIKNNYATRCTYRRMFNAARVVSDKEILKLQCKNDCTEKIGVMVGHRGTRSSNHMDGFMFLKRMKRTVDVICPLSIGEKNYINEVVKGGSYLFGDNFRYIESWMSKEEYYSYLVSNVNIGLFPTITAEAIVTILFLISFGIKIYINPKSETYWLFKEMGFIVYPFDEELKENDFFMLLSEEEKMKNYHNALKYTSTEEFLKNWNEVLTYCEKT